ncbi:MAG: flippase [Anaerolineales bacterium]|nr:flippase [Anaerolineales bacterium]
MILALVNRVRESDFIRKILETFITRVLLIGIGLITSVITARILGPENRGFLAASIALLMILYQFSNMGLHAANVYYVSRDRSLLPVLVGNSMLVGFVVGGGASLLTAIVFGIKPQWAPVTGLMLILPLVTVPIDLTALLLQNILIGVYNIRIFNVIQVASRLASIGLILGLIVLSIVSVESMLVTNLMTSMFALLWTLWSLKRYLTGWPHASIALFRSHVRYGLMAYFAALFSFIVLRSDMLMVKYMLGAEQLGYYALAVTMGDMMYMLPVTVGTILFPRLSAMTSNQEKEALTFRITLVLSVILLVMLGIACILAKPAVRILYGEEFLPAVPAFYWLSIGLWFLSVNTMFTNYFASIGMPIVSVFSPALASLVNFVANLYLTPRWGISGTAIASSVAYGMMFFTSLVYIVLMRRRRRVAIAYTGP